MRFKVFRRDEYSTKCKEEYFLSLCDSRVASIMNGHHGHWSM